MPKYSLRAFARHLGVAPSRLSEIFQGKQGLSGEAARKIGQRLELNETDLAYFSDLAEAEHARSAVKRKTAQLRLQQSALASEYHVLTTDAFRAIADWYHIAILQLFHLRSFQQDPEWIAAALKISPDEASAALDRLLRLEMLNQTKNGKLVPAREFVATTDGVPSQAIKKFHQQVLECALRSVQEQSVDQRGLSANIFALEKSHLPRAKEVLKRFRRRFVKEFSKPQKKDSVYCLSMQLFEMTNNEISHE